MSTIETLDLETERLEMDYSREMMKEVAAIKRSQYKAVVAPARIDKLREAGLKCIQNPSFELAERLCTESRNILNEILSAWELIGDGIFDPSNANVEKQAWTTAFNAALEGARRFRYQIKPEYVKTRAHADNFIQNVEYRVRQLAAVTDFSEDNQVRRLKLKEIVDGFSRGRA